MWLYFFIVFYIYFCSIAIYKNRILKQSRRKTRDNLFIFLTMGLLLLLNCLRSLTTGNDTLSYYHLFNYYTSGVVNFEYSYEDLYWMNFYVDIAWRFINRVFGVISTDYQLFISFIACILYFVTIKHIKKNSTNVALSVLLFFLLFYHPYLNILRQAMAIVIILLGYEELLKKKTIRFVFMVVIATLFHKYAFVSLALIVFMNYRYKQNRAIGIIIIAAILSVSGVVFYIPQLLGYSGDYLNDQTGISTVFSLCLNGAIFLLLEYICPKSIDVMEEFDLIKYREVNFYRWINMVAFVLSIMEISLPALYRVEYFFTIYQVTGVPYLLHYSNKPIKTRSLVMTVIIVIVVVYNAGKMIFRPEWITEFPYKFFFSK